MTDLSGRRPPRPTLRFLRLLPRESFPEPGALQAIENREWSQVRIDSIEHPLIADAIRRFAQGLPDRHQEASKQLGRAVFEVRSRTGAAWRGAAVLDEHGDPWLVWAAPHDKFHAQVCDVLKNLDRWMPTAAEYKLRDRDAEANRLSVWHKETITFFCQAVAEAVNTGKDTFSFPGYDHNTHLTLSITLEHDAPTGAPETDSSLVTLQLRLGGSCDSFVQLVLPVLQPDISLIDSTYTQNGDLELWVSVSQAKLFQLLAAVGISDGEIDPNPPCTPLSHLHYVGCHYLSEALVIGAATRAVCGLWFVPTRDESADLPLCPECERRKPVAQAAAALIESLRDQGVQGS